VPIRIAVKDQANDCTFFSPRVTVARDVSNAGLQNRPPMAGVSEPQPRSAADARDAFARLFKI
jgi:hypothetical protein